ncbi:11395_t:CDS:2, partial [Ambispora leptoticha]
QQQAAENLWQQAENLWQQAENIERDADLNMESDVESRNQHKQETQNSNNQQQQPENMENQAAEHQRQQATEHRWQQAAENLWQQVENIERDTENQCQAKNADGQWKRQNFIEQQAEEISNLGSTSTHLNNSRHTSVTISSDEYNSDECNALHDITNLPTDHCEVYQVARDRYTKNAKAMREKMLRKNSKRKISYEIGENSTFQIFLDLFNFPEIQSLQSLSDFRIMPKRALDPQESPRSKKI